MKRSVMILTALAALFGAAQLAVAADGQAIYEKSCKGCHAKGMMGAPKVGDKEKWAPLIKGGQAALDEAVAKGKGKMPAQKLSAEDIKAANAYIISQSQ